MIPLRHQVRHLAQAYFHQDFDLEAPTPLAVVELFASSEPRAVVDELISDLHSVLDSSMTDKEIGALWVHEYGAAYDPLVDGVEYRDG